MNKTAEIKKQTTAVADQPKQRDSNLELFRIILMFFIIAHHYVVNSSLLDYVDMQHITGNDIFLQIFAMFGKPAINAFTLITGYFMVRARVTVARFLRTFLEVKFYDFLFYLIFLLSGYASFSVVDLFTTVFSLSYWAGTYYTGTYIMLFLLMPLLNVLVRNMTKKQYQYLLIVLLVYFTGFSTLFSAFLYHHNFSLLGWMATMYLLGGYISLYPIKAFQSAKVGAAGMAASIFLMIASILVVDFIGIRFGFDRYDYMYSDANKFLALTSSVFSFIFFKNLKIPYNKVINRLAAPIFGILLIHAHSDTMRRLIWQDIFHCPKYYDSPYLILHAVGTVVAVYLVCWALDSLRIRFIEKPLFGRLKTSKWLLKIEEKMVDIL